jgi:hypothetical protein
MGSMKMISAAGLAALVIGLTAEVVEAGPDPCQPVQACAAVKVVAPLPKACKPVKVFAPLPRACEPVKDCATVHEYGPIVSLPIRLVHAVHVVLLTGHLPRRLEEKEYGVPQPVPAPTGPAPAPAPAPPLAPPPVSSAT